MRGADTEDKQLRDDLMTLLIAGHETTAAALTWGFFSLAQAPEALKTLQDEVDKVVGDRRPSWDDIKQMPFLCMVRCDRRSPHINVAGFSMQELFSPQGTPTRIPWATLKL